MIQGNSYIPNPIKQTQTALDQPARLPEISLSLPIRPVRYSEQPTRYKEPRPVQYNEQQPVRYNEPQPVRYKEPQPAAPVRQTEIQTAYRPVVQVRRMLAYINPFITKEMASKEKKILN